VSVYLGSGAEALSRPRLPTGGGPVEVGRAGLRGSGPSRPCPMGYMGQMSCLACNFLF
jgi:hypothetical protein